MLSAELVEEAPALEGLRDEWDGLAVATGRPYCAPAWMLAWWRHVAPTAAVLRTAIVRDGSQLVGIAPFFGLRGRARLIDYHLLGAGTAHRIGPLVEPGRGEEIVELLAAALAGGSPAPSAIHLQWTEASHRWTERLSCHWPGRVRPWAHTSLRMTAPTLDLRERTYGEFLASRSARGQRQLRGMQRKLSREGATLRMTERADCIERDLATFARLHNAKWAPRGGSRALIDGAERMLRDAALELLAQRRFRLWTMEVQGEAVCSEIFVAAGGEVASWNGGFDPAWRRLQPGVMTMLAAIEDAFERGEHRFDFGGGEYASKQRFADRDDPVVCASLLPRTASYPLARAQYLPTYANSGARRVFKRLSPEIKARVRRVLQRGQA